MHASVVVLVFCSSYYCALHLYEISQANISIKNVQPFSLPSKEPWTQNPPKVILDLHKNKKSEVDSHIFKTEFLEIKSAYKHYMSIYTDGSKQDEKVACAVISPNLRTVLDYLTIVLFLPLKPRL